MTSGDRRPGEIQIDRLALLTIARSTVTAFAAGSTLTAFAAGPPPMHSAAHRVQSVESSLLLGAEDRIEALDRVGAALERGLTRGGALGHEFGHAVEALGRGQWRRLRVLTPGRSVVFRPIHVVVGHVVVGHVFVGLMLHVRQKGQERGLLVRTDIQDVVKHTGAARLMSRKALLALLFPFGVIAALMRFGGRGRRRGVLGEGA